MNRLPIYVDCGRCSAADLCVSKGGPERCWDASGYPAGSIHPSNTVLRPESLVPPRAWGRIRAATPFIPIIDGNDSYGLDDFGLCGESAISYLATPEGKARPLVCVLLDRDEVLEQQWRGWKPPSAFDVAVIPPCFSTWGDRPPFDHMFESLRTACVAAKLAASGPVVPVVPLSPHLDYGWWRAFLVPGRPTDVAVDLWAKTPRDWTRMITEVARLNETLHSFDLRLVVYRVASRDRMREVSGLWQGRVVFLSRAPIDKAILAGHAVDPLTLRSAAAPSQTRRHLALANTRSFGESLSNEAILSASVNTIEARSSRNAPRAFDPN